MPVLQIQNVTLKLFLEFQKIFWILLIYSIFVNNDNALNMDIVSFIFSKIDLLVYKNHKFLVSRETHLNALQCLVSFIKLILHKNKMFAYTSFISKFPTKIWHKTDISNKKKRVLCPFQNGLNNYPLFILYINFI